MIISNFKYPIFKIIITYNEIEFGNIYLSRLLNLINRPLETQYNIY